MGVRARNRARTLKQGATAAARRVEADIKVNQAAPTDGPSPSEGADSGSHNWLHITVEMPDATTTLDWILWEFDESAELWRIRTDVGTQSIATADSPDGSIIEISGAPRVFIQLLNFSGVFTEGVNVWLSGSSF